MTPVKTLLTMLVKILLTMLKPNFSCSTFRRRRRRDEEEEEEKNRAFHHTFVMKLFDRSVDLAQFRHFYCSLI
jgi:hypothetical protein